MFRSAFARRRCLIPADGFYEWKGPRPGEGKGPKVPHYIHRADDEPFTFAGLWESRAGVDTYCILTQPPNALMETIHDRQPIILEGEAAAAWANPATPVSELPGLLAPWEPDEWQADVVSTRVNSPRNEGPDLIEPV